MKCLSAFVFVVEMHMSWLFWGTFSMKKKHGPETHQACYCALTSHMYVVQPKQDVVGYFLG